MTTKERVSRLPVEGHAPLRVRLFHLMFLLTRPMTLGARAIVFDRERGTVFLVRHTYIPGWHLPGGGVEPGETMEAALERELREEGNIELTDLPEVKSLHFNRKASRRDHVALYLVTRFRQATAKRRDREIAETGFFPLDNLPEDTTPATRRRLAEAFSGATPSPYW
jgi:ADP-ribose pyrophosphatase YjhB (NUDIX family)